jgi:hypothetical protein
MRAVAIVIVIFGFITGLYNRHGFVTIAQEQLKLAQR